MRIKLILSLSFIFIITQLLFSQVTEEWVQRYSHLYWSSPYSLIEDKFGNIYIVGSNSNTLLCLKYDTNGRLIWGRKNNATIETVGNCIALDDSNNVYLLGTKNYNIIVLYKYTSDGLLLWYKQYTVPANPFLNLESLYHTKSGNIYICGDYNIGYNNYTLFVKKYDQYGVLLWDFTYNQGNLIGVSRSAVDSSENIYLGGTIYHLDQDYLTIKIDSSKNIKWIREYNTGRTDFINSLSINSIGEVAVTGDCYGRPEYNIQYLIGTIKYEPNGDSVWVRTYNYLWNGFQEAIDCKLDNNGNVYITGESEGPSSFDFVTLKYSSNGGQQWVNHYDGYNMGDFPIKMALDKFNDVYVTGYSYNPHGNADMLTIKYSSTGVQQWIQRYNSEYDSTDMGEEIIVDSSFNVYVLGSSWSPQNGFDLVLIKYSQPPIGIKPISNEIPKTFALFQNYPNPFNPTTKIKFEVPTVGAYRDTPLRLLIYDILGKEVATLVNEQLKPGSYEVEWDGSNYPCGVYFYKLMAGDYRETRRMVLIK